MFFKLKNRPINSKILKMTENNKEMKKETLKIIQQKLSFMLSLSKKKINAIDLPISSLSLFIIWSAPLKKPDKPPLDRLIERLLDFYHLWPPQQWLTSLAGLVILYAITGYYYNRWLRETMRGHWLSIRARVWLIIFDLLINLGLGLYYMDHRETIIGHIMMKCPIAISPVIFACELLAVSWYYYYNYYLPFIPRWIRFKEKRDQNKCWIFWKKKKKAFQDFITRM